ncbi:MAG: SOS response-associated peptidase [Oscillospiraceae bacterium]|jgi:putative SOS response-associated peptidase YedK|nr:SOS response-associated peptidase [Oscillospiraceae bacterium]
MCGRFYIEPDSPTLADILTRAQGWRYGDLPLKTSGDVYPTDIVAAQTGTGEYAPMKWGFTSFGKSIIFNARSETAGNKPMFRDAMRARRCLIPASGYYEWRRDGKQKIKYRFYIPDDIMYLAGCWRRESDADPDAPPRFVILTRAATPQLAEIHDRMPVIIPREYAEDWLGGESPTLAGDRVVCRISEGHPPRV